MEEYHFDGLRFDANRRTDEFLPDPTSSLIGQALFHAPFEPDGVRWRLVLKDGVADVRQRSAPCVLQGARGRIAAGPFAFTTRGALLEVTR